MTVKSQISPILMRFKRGFDEGWSQDINFPMAVVNVAMLISFI